MRNCRTSVDRSILQRIAAGDESAVKHCMDEFGGLVWSIARRFTDSVTEAEDATQEIFLEIWKSAARYDPKKGSESVFVTTIARRRVIDRLRARQRVPPTEELDDESMQAAGMSSPGDAVVGAEAALAQRALELLSPAQREVLLMSIVQGMTHSEIATATGRPLGTVKTQVRRGLARVRDYVESAGDASE